MGYETSFSGSFDINQALKEKHEIYLFRFSTTRRMARAVAAVEKRPDPARRAARLPIGPEGAYFTGSKAPMGQDYVGVIDFNKPPVDQPSLWCPWRPITNWEFGIPDVGKHYEYIAWLKYVLKHFLTPWGYQLSGMVEWQGEDSDDFGRLSVDAGRVYVEHGMRMFSVPELA